MSLEVQLSVQNGGTHLELDQELANRTLIFIKSTVLPGITIPYQEKCEWKTGHCIGHITQWQNNENGVGANHKLDHIISDGAGIFLDGVSFAETDGNGDLEVINLPTFNIHVGPLDSNDIEINYGGKQSTYPGNDRKLGKYDGGKRKVDFGLT
ncbi:putative Fibronectin type iii domain-containing protein [Seiridium cardinale]|uniref:Fibronectin type iii domain-containing protein n=1 Tax=Seiridium cardinale TaxID=138064 RepID=A0ABR2XH11_9PEZI